MSFASTAPAVIGALLTLLRAQLSDTDVIDGPVISGATLSEAVTLGVQDDDLGVSAVDATLASEGYAREPLRESYVINCSTTVLASTNDVATARARAFALLSEVGSAIATQPTLAGLVLSITVGSFSLRQDTDRVRVLFALDVDAYTTEP